MRKSFAVVLGIVAVAAAGCSHGVSRIRTHALASPNPTRYSFPLPVEEVHARALEAFSRDHQHKEPIFEKPAKTDDWRSSLEAESSTNRFRKAIFNDPANVHDIVLNSSGAPVASSAVYRGREGGLLFFATFHLHLADKGKATVVSVKTSEARVVNGKKYGLGSCGPGWHWNHVKVRPTTVEEYSILSYLGRHLGITNMPAVIVPAE